MNRALIVIDYTYDFIADDGKLTCGSYGQEIENNIINLISDFQKEKNWIVIAVDKHFANDVYHPEVKLFPPHNIMNTKGRDLYGKLFDWYKKNKESDNLHYMDKNRYSSFAGTNLDIYLKERKITEIHLCGVCTDICVLHTAIDAYNLGYNIIIYKNSVASFDSEAHKWALNHFKNVLGASII